MFAAYSSPQKVIGQFKAVINRTIQQFQIVDLQADELPQVADLLKVVQLQLASIGQASLLKTRSIEELQKYYAQDAKFLGVFKDNELIATSMVAPVTNFAELGRVDTAPNLADLPFNGLTEDVVGLNIKDAKPEDFCVFGAMAVNQEHTDLGIAQRLWFYRLQAALDMDKPFACTTISASNKGVLKHYNNQGWLIDDSKTISENGKEIVLHRLIANKEILLQNLAHAQPIQTPLPAYA